MSPPSNRVPPENLQTAITLIVKLRPHSAQGITGKDFALAEKIEQVIQWQTASDCQEGMPDDPGFAYIECA